VAVCIGTKEGKVLFYRIDSAGNKKIGQSKGGASFGSITSIDVSEGAEHCVAGTESGEIMTFNILTQLQPQ
jgi:hypothetical protein